MSSIFPRELCPFPVFPPCSLCPPCEPLFFYLWNKRKPGYRAVAKRRNVYAAMPSNKNVSSGHEEKGRLRQDTCPLRALCALRANQRFYLWNERKPGYRAVAKRRNAYAAMPSYKSVSRRREKKKRLRSDTCLLRALCALRANHCFFIFGTNENRGIAPSQKEETLTPRCPRTKVYRAVAKRKSAYALIPVLSVLSVPSVRTNVFIFGTNENRGIAPSQKEETLTPQCPRTKAYRAVAKRKSAYAAMLVLSVLSVRTLFFFKDTPT